MCDVFSQRRKRFWFARKTCDIVWLVPVPEEGLSNAEAVENSEICEILGDVLAHISERHGVGVVGPEPFSPKWGWLNKSGNLSSQEVRPEQRQTVWPCPSLSKGSSQSECRHTHT